MNILIPHSWLTEYIKTDAKPADIARCLSLCGPSVESVTRKGRDYIYNIEITTNRIDTVSVTGIAREAAAILPRFGYQAKLKAPKLAQIKPPKTRVPLEITNNPQLCRRIIAVPVAMKVTQSPRYIQDHITKTGQRPLLSAIDITNFVMAEIGHPIHAFDYDRITSHQMHIRESKPGEKITTLENKTYTLTGGDIVIDDGSGRIIDLPGIIGINNSIVTPKTKRVLFFVETNNPVKIRHTSMTHGIRTLAATINEKNVDPELAQTALLRALELAFSLFSGHQLSPIIDLYPSPPKPRQISLTHQFISDRLGVDPKPNLVKSALTALGFKINHSAHTYRVEVPSWRLNDVTQKEDIVEEVARIYGYYNLPSLLPPLNNQIGISVHLANIPQRRQKKIASKLKSSLVFGGYTETIHTSLISKSLINKANLIPANHLKLKNPLSSDWEYLPTSLLPNLLATVNFNQHHQSILRLFELAHTYWPTANAPAKEIPELAFVSNSDSFLAFKGQLENSLATLNIKKYQIKARSESMFSPRASFAVYTKRTKIAHFGALDPQLKTQFQLNGQIYMAVINLHSLAKIYQPEVKFRPISPYATIVHDLTLTVPAKVTYGQIKQAVLAVSPYIAQVEFIDSFRNRYSIRIYYQSSKKNLSETEVAPIRNKLLARLKKLQVNLYLP